jgi:isovaleryl-CoA dehydrogenase
MDHEGALRKALLPELFDLGVMGIEVPEAYGGAGSSFFNAILAVEAVATVDPSVSVLIDVQNTLVANAILRWATESQKQQYFPRLTSEWVGSYALSEPVSGSDAFALQCRATRADGGWVLNGQKLWITNANESSLFIVFATVDPALGYKGITAFLVERDTPGFSVGKKEDKLGIRASSTTELILEDCEVPEENVLGEVGRGVNVLMSGLDFERAVLSGGPLGIMAACMDVVLPYLHERTQFGQPIGEFQLMQGKLADMYSTMMACRAYVYAVGRACDQAHHPEAVRALRKDAAGAILYSAEKATWMAGEAIQCLGGNGYINDYPTGRLWRDAKLYEIGAGTSEIRRWLIGRELFADTI